MNLFFRIAVCGAVIALAFLGGTPKALGQGKILDSLYLVLENHPANDTNRVRLLRKICFYEASIDNDAMLRHAEEALAISKRLNYTAGIGFSYRYFATYYHTKGDYGQAVEYALEMQKTFEPTTNYKGIGQSLSLLGLIWQDSHDYAKAMAYFKESLRIFKKANLHVDAGYTLNQIGALHNSMHQYDSASKYFEEGVTIRRQINDREGLSSSYANLGAVYVGQRDYTRAISAIDTSFMIMNELGLVDHFRTAINLANLGAAYTHLGRYREAATNLEKSEALLKDLNERNLLGEVYKYKADLEVARGDLKKAMHYDGLKDAINDSLFNEERARQFAKMQTLYETEKKERTIRDLELQRENQNLKERFMILGLLLVLTAGVAIYVILKSGNKKVHALLASQKELNEKLKETDQFKSRFFANISHEFRTPLSLIIGPVENELRNENLQPGFKKLLNTISRNARQLFSLVNEVLDLSTVEAKKMDLRLAKGNVKEFVAVLAASFDSWAQSKGVEFTIDLRADEPKIWFDGEKLEKIVNNLLSNAFKFTPAGRCVSFTLAQNTIAGEVTLVVADTGSGIAVEDQPYLFTPFYKSREAGGDYVGTGLGLALVKEIVHLYGGQVSLQSEQGRGTTVSVTLPFAKEKMPTHAIYDSETSPRAKSMDLSADHHAALAVAEEEIMADDARPSILIIEDHPDLRHFVAEIVSDEYSVLTANNGKEGLEIARERMPDIIISDVMMPNMDGIELAEQIRSDERTSHIPIILLTAKADHDSRIVGLKTGADDYLTKPFSTEELLVRISNLLTQRKKLIEKYRAQVETVVVANTVTPATDLSMDEKFLIRAKNVVIVHLDDPLFGVEQFASEMNLSRAQLFRKLKAIVGSSPNDLINDIRLNRAAELILSKADSLTQISYSVGYNEPSYFAKKFKKKFGMSPTEYQDRSSETAASIPS